MTTPIPSPHLPPTAGLFNALVRHANRQLRDRIAELRALLDDARNHNHELRTARNYADTAAAGYIDRTFLDAP
ncbi:hypothetical protein AAW14_06065 [Streptomyces hygroscopicus]|uniref:hypothetical protein n=1 Tax=Streptomyces hygroscopicus TaxID=1912 RepID=UPI00224008FB|nr:hypothetical protein [Streptomyces hygroscopicus]MCW7941611.1 hypothetical protein [Streptomyces hygroscopicus]